MSDLPRQLDDFEPLPGTIKADYSDFVVEEIPLYPADEVGTHTYFLLEKTGLSTTQAVHDLARALNVRRHDIGFAGQKDSKAITRQWMSVEHVAPERVSAIDLPRLRILKTTRHGNKLRLGHLRGNAFTIRVRQTRPERLAELQDALRLLSRGGVPNYFGSQRFGYRGDTWRTGRAILCGRPEEAIDMLLGRPGPKDHGPIRRARQLYERGDYVKAARQWPGMFHAERRALKSLGSSGGQRKRALAAIDKSTRTFYLSAYQSHLFNQVVARRIESGLGTLWTGDLAWLHATGAVFRVEDAAHEQPRADAFEISPSGPLFGRRMTEPSAAVAEVEAGVIAAERLPPGVFERVYPRVSGGRRPLRFPLDQARISLGADQRGPYLELWFVLPRGCYATALLRELFRAEQTPSHEPTNKDTEDPTP